MASEAQVNYMKSLASGKEVTEPALTTLLANEIALSQLNNDQVNEILSVLRSLPNKATPSDNPSVAELYEKVSEGYYFLEEDPVTGNETFYKIDKPKPPSRWTGHTFINVQASDYLYPVRDKARRDKIIAAIVENDPIKCMNEYGIRLGRCGACGRTLTNKDSRLQGLGPICAARISGRPTDQDLETLQQLGLL